MTTLNISIEINNDVHPLAAVHILREAGFQAAKHVFQKGCPQVDEEFSLSLQVAEPQLVKATLFRSE